MIDRYSTKRMKDIWSEKNKFNIYLKVEIATIKAWVEEGLIPKKDLELIKKNSFVNLKRLREIEAEVKHDVIAFTRMISETLGNEKKWIHYGLTSTDVVDTSYAIQIKQANKYILEDLNEFSKVLKKNALTYKYTPVIGRTHGVHAEITSLGLKFALWYDEMQRNIKRFKFASNDIEVGKISGAVGNFSSTPSKLQDKICKNLGIGSVNISTQVLQRDRHANYISVLSIIGSTLEKIAVEIRNSQRTEVSEIFEKFSKGQKGSSAMPHKKNPITSENITGIARLLRSYIIPILENNALWYERDLTHSCVERVIIPDATNLIDYSITRFLKTIKHLVIDKEQMMKNINLTQGVIYSQKILNLLIEKGMSREGAYDIIQPLALKAFEKKIPFIKLLKENNKINALIKEKELNDIFDYKIFLIGVDDIFKRVFK